jgi:hypothetical protein
MNFTTAPLRGRLGNLLFQIGATCTYAKSTDRKSVFMPSSECLQYKSNILRKVDFVENYSVRFFKLRLPFFYTPIPLMQGQNVYLGDSYFQSEKYLDKELVTELFRMKPEEKEYILNNYPDISERVSLHVRRGDYLQVQHAHPIIPVETFYNKALELFPGKKIMIFSDDIPWCKENFKTEDTIFVSEPNDYIEIYMMSLCSDNIIANSSFSWWGAYLNENPQKKVIAPEPWFTNDAYNARDIVPDSWIKIKYV